MKRLIASVVLAVMAGLAVGAPSPPGGQQVIEEIVAVVNDDIITLSECRQQYELSLAQLRGLRLPADEFDKQVQNLKKELLDVMITELLLLQKAKELNINVSEQLRAMIERIKQENNLSSDADLRRAVEQQGMSYETWLKQYEEGWMRQAVLFTEVERTIALEDSEVFQYYKKNPKEFTAPAEYKIHAIFLSGEAHSAEQLEGLKKDIEARLKAGSAFADVASELSDPPMKESRGDLGTFKEGELDKTLEAAVERLNPGQTSGWVSTPNGWYLLQLEARTESRLRSFDEARKEVEEKLFNEKRATKVEAYLKTLRERSFVKVLKPNPIDD